MPQRLSGNTLGAVLWRCERDDLLIPLLKRAPMLYGITVADMDREQQGPAPSKNGRVVIFRNDAQIYVAGGETHPTDFFLPTRSRSR
ncbi:hypothetical protein DESC_700168 [Desulfosarcina cetonica]|uniref:hypothetical protein n=1 Tax=Desulfosarcina cetonica TaxID=90730 RepID=UPI0006CF4155|nr:hypothetical protein [Desulfosarcina cetonica]VTR68412.1 hypothetical protein DESC_700168 [Desulfosarcina cetonica]